MIFRKCEKCGANLDPGEVCKCTGEKNEPEKPLLRYICENCGKVSYHAHTPIKCNSCKTGFLWRFN